MRRSCAFAARGAEGASPESCIVSLVPGTRRSSDPTAFHDTVEARTQDAQPGGRLSHVAMGTRERPLYRLAFCAFPGGLERPVRVTDHQGWNSYRRRGQALVFHIPCIAFRVPAQDGSCLLNRECCMPLCLQLPAIDPPWRSKGCIFRETCRRRSKWVGASRGI